MRGKKMVEFEPRGKLLQKFNVFILRKIRFDKMLILEKNASRFISFWFLMLGANVWLILSCLLCTNMILFLRPQRQKHPVNLHSAFRLRNPKKTLQALKQTRAIVQKHSNQKNKNHARSHPTRGNKQTSLTTSCLLSLSGPGEVRLCAGTRRAAPTPKLSVWHPEETSWLCFRLNWIFVFNALKYQQKMRKGPSSRGPNTK